MCIQSVEIQTRRGRRQQYVVYLIFKFGHYNLEPGNSFKFFPFSKNLLLRESLRKITHPVSLGCIDEFLTGRIIFWPPRCRTVESSCQSPSIARKLFILPKAMQDS